jgi:hypothetical protein
VGKAGAEEGLAPQGGSCPTPGVGGVQPGRRPGPKEGGFVVRGKGLVGPKDKGGPVGGLGGRICREVGHRVAVAA